jgi:hypothetical protein
MQTPDELRISGSLRAALVFAGVAVLYAGLVLLIAPADSARLFAWDIQPPVTAAFMGAFYMTAIPMLFVFARRGTPWRHVRPVLPTLFILSATMLIATALHLDRFLWSNAVAWAWAGLYLLYPPLTALLYIQHARGASGPESVVVPVMRGVRPLAFATALAFAGLGLALLVAPARTASFWPWMLTPLTGRVVGGWLLFLSAALAAMGRERDWTSIRLLFPEAALVMLLLLIGVVRFRDSFRWGEPVSWIYVAVMSMGLLVSTTLFVVHEARLRRSTTEA